MSRIKETTVSREIPDEYQVRPAIFWRGRALLLKQADLGPEFTFVSPQWEFPRLTTRGTKDLTFADVAGLIKSALNIDVEVYQELERDTHPESGRFGGVVNFSEVTFLCKLFDQKVKINYEPAKYQDFAWVDTKTLKENSNDWPLELRTRVTLFDKLGENERG